MSKKEIGYCLKNGFVPHYDGTVECSGFPQAPSANAIRRRGKVCILDFYAEQYWVSGTQLFIPSGAKLIVPKSCIPKEETTIPLIIGYVDRTLTNIYAQYEIVDSTINVNGEIIIPTVSTNYDIISINIKQVGYEI